MLAASTVMVVASMALSGCGPDNPAPKPFNPPKAPSAASSSSSVDAVPQMPDEAKQNNAAGAKAFMRYYFELQDYATHTGDVAELDRLSGPDCLSCNNIIETIQRIYEAGGRLSGQGWTVLSVREFGQSDEVRLGGRFRFARETTIDKAGASPRVAAPITRDFESTVKWGSGEWEIAEWALLY